MTPVESKANDTKLVFAIAGLVVLGTAGIALLAGWSSSEDDPAPARQVERRVTTPAASTAVHPDRVRTAPIRTASFEPAAPVVHPVEPVEAVEPAEIDGADAPFVPAADEPFVERGLEAYRTREFRRAVGYWQAEVDARPQRAWSQYMLALSLWKHGRLDEAAAAMEASVAVGPDSIKGLVNLARIQNDRGEYARALDAANAALAIDAEDPSARFLAGRSLFNLERFDEAEAELIASLAADPENGYAQNLLGLVFLEQERALEAIVAFEKAVETRPDVAFIRNNLGMALELGGERSEAIASYRAAVELDPEHAKAASNLARLNASGEPDAGPVASVEQTLTVAVAATDGENLP